MKSPKGTYRLKEILIVGVTFLILVALSGGFDNYGVWHLDKALNPSGWIFKQINNIAEAFTGIFILYIGHRVINHKRTHEFTGNEMYSLAITSVWIIAIALVVASAFR